MDALLTHLSRWRPFRAVVVGDFMLDESVFGDAQRLSPDAPVPVLHARRIERRAGGAANVCLDLAALHGSVEAVGVVGDDDDGRHLLGCLTEAGVGVEGMVVDSTRPTTVKRTLIGLAQQRHPQKMFRVDVESNDPVAPHICDALIARFSDLVLRTDVVCVEDYAKGVCTSELCHEMVMLARGSDKTVFVDPALGADFGAYRGATAITPNRNEAELATGLATSPDGEASVNGVVSSRLLESLDVEAVVLTLDRHGALLHRKGCEPEPIPTRARGVYDVTGAGDMMLAALAASRANGVGWTDAVRFANVAAGLEVEVFGVEPIPLERVRQELIRERSPASGRVRTLEDLAAEITTRHAKGETVVLTNGCFDVLHSGHVRVIEQAAAMGDFLVVAINDDASVARLKGPDRPINPSTERAGVIGALEGVDAVVVFGEDTAERVVEALHPEILVKGGDYGPDEIVERSAVERLGGKVVIVPPVDGRSSTETIRRIRGTP